VFIPRIRTEAHPCALGSFADEGPVKINLGFPTLPENTAAEGGLPHNQQYRRGALKHRDFHLVPIFTEQKQQF